MMHVKKKQFLLWTLSILWMLIILYFSGQSRIDSAELSMNVRGLFATVMEFLGLGKYAHHEMLHHFVRKCAHVFLYMVLGFSVTASAKASGWRRYVLWAVLICFGYATSDELHQAFVPGRGPLLSDVFLDTLSAVGGAVIYVFLGFLDRKCRRKPN